MMGSICSTKRRTKDFLLLSWFDQVRTQVVLDEPASCGRARWSVCLQLQQQFLTSLPLDRLSSPWSPIDADLKVVDAGLSISN